jgi:GNAT superfamily N-acetyltransferase
VTMLKMLAIDRLCLDFQPPENVIESRVQEYVERMTRGEKIEPIIVCFDGARYLLKDGFHRVEAARRMRRRRISAEVTRGTLEEMEDEFRQALQTLKRDLRRERRSWKICGKRLCAPHVRNRYSTVTFGLIFESRAKTQKRNYFVFPEKRNQGIGSMNMHVKPRKPAKPKEVSEEIAKRLEELATWCRETRDVVDKAFRRGTEEAIKIGMWLNEAKQLHKDAGIFKGEWGQVRQRELQVHDANGAILHGDGPLPASESGLQGRDGPQHVQANDRHAEAGAPALAVSRAVAEARAEHCCSDGVGRPRDGPRADPKGHG